MCDDYIYDWYKFFALFFYKFIDYFLEWKEYENLGFSIDLGNFDNSLYLYITYLHYVYDLFTMIAYVRTNLERKFIKFILCYPILRSYLKYDDS